MTADSNWSPACSFGHGSGHRMRGTEGIGGPRERSRTADLTLSWASAATEGIMRLWGVPEFKSHPHRHTESAASMQVRRLSGCRRSPIWPCGHDAVTVSPSDQVQGSAAMSSRPLSVSHPLPDGGRASKAMRRRRRHGSSSGRMRSGPGRDVVRRRQRGPVPPPGLEPR
jgi:hypothetical protein